MNKKMKIIFTLSLVTNILLLGVLGGQAYHMKRGWHGSWGDLRKTLTPETRALMRQTFKEKEPEIFAIFKEVREKKNILIEAFSAEVFDPVAYDAAARDLQQLGIKIANHKLETFKTLGAELPQEDREVLAQKLAAAVLGKHGRKGRWAKHSSRDSGQHENKER